MSAYGHQMEHMYSARSLSGGGSEMRSSSYTMESGFYITSFAATIFVAALAALGLLLITLLVSLAMMLQSCQSRNAGFVELRKINYDYGYCKVYSLHAELNKLEGHNNVPKNCRDLAIHYIKGGQYARDLDLTKSVIEDYFDNVRPSDNGLDEILIDIDGIFPPNPHSFNLFQRFLDNSISNCILEARNLRRALVLRLCKNLGASGWHIILLSREPEAYRNATVDNLVSAGFGGCWSSLMMRDEDKDYAKENEWFSRQRNVIGENKGFRVKGIISGHMNALNVADTGMLKFLLPDPMCDKFEQQRRA